MTATILNVLVGFAVPLGTGLLWSGDLPGRHPRFSHLVSSWLPAAIGGGGVALLTHGIAYATGAGASALAAIAYWWWKRRKRRDRAPRAYGAKSRALIAALVRKAREAAKPRPVLRPVPGGAG